MDLPQSSDCEERFDLALYAETGVELIDWAADVLSCSNKHATIRFLPARVSRASLETRVRQLALSATFSP
jgi:hypothetical protein